MPEEVIDLSARKRAAELLDAHFEGRVTLSEFEAELRDSADSLVAMAVHVVLSQPRRGNLGVSDHHWNTHYWPAVLTVRAELAKGLEGKAPPVPPYPILSAERVVGLFALAVLAAIVAAEHVVHAYHAFGASTGAGVLTLLYHTAVATFLAMGALFGGRAAVNRFRLLRLRRRTRL